MMNTENRSVGSKSLSRSKSIERTSPANSSSPIKSQKAKASKTESRSRTPKRKKHIRKHSHSRSRSGSFRFSRSRSRGRRDSYDEKRSGKRSRHKRSLSRSPSSRSRRMRGGDRDNPKESRCIGIFGMSLHTDERMVRDVFERYGPIEDVQIVYDYHTGRSRGFAFVYYKYIEDAVEAKENAPGTEVDGHRVRVDFSITERAHTPTPGTYMGFKNNAYRSGGSSSRYRRSPSPYKKSSRYRSHSRSISRGRY